MLRTRIIPTLLLRNECLVKTRQFTKYTYVGDPCNTVRIFNELEVDEMFFLDITPGRHLRGPSISVLNDISNECFMPLGYGGGICSLDQAKSVFDIGFEKVAINSESVANPDLIAKLACHYGSQAVIASIDVKKNLLGKYVVRTHSGRINTRLDPVDWAKEVERRGAGEILLTSIDREGTWEGFDFDLVKRVADAVSIPVIAHGGAGTIQHIAQVVRQSNASAVALGSMIVFQKKGMGVLVNFPDKDTLETKLGSISV
jgi:cyclase